MLYCGFPYSTSAPQSISNTHSSDHILTPIPTTYNSISPSIPFSSFTATSQHYSLQELNSTPAGSVNPHLIYPPHSSVLLPTYNSDSSWTTAQQPPQPSPKLDLKQGDVGNTQKIILDSCLIREDENYVESPDEESVVGQLNFSSLEQEKRYRERRQRNNQAAKHSRRKRRERENELRLQVDQLKAENLRLRQQLDEVDKKHVVVSGVNELNEKQSKRVLISSENNENSSSYLYG